MKVAYLLDSSAGVVENPLKDVYVLPLTIIVNDKGAVNQYADSDGIISLERLFQFQTHALVTTSQAAIAEVKKKVNHLLTRYDLVVAIPISSGLSQNYETFRSLRNEYQERLLLLNCMAVQSGIEWLVEDLQKFVQANPNFCPTDLLKINEQNRHLSHGVIMVGNCTQLIRGGRLPSYKGLIIKLMGIRLLIQLNSDVDGKLSYFDKSFNDENGVVKSIELIDTKINFKKNGIDKVAYITTFLDEKKNERMFNLYKAKLMEYCGFKGKISQGRICSTIAVHTGIDTCAIYIKALANK